VYIFSWSRLGIQLPLTTLSLIGVIVLVTNLARRPLYRWTVTFLGLAGVLSLFTAFRLDGTVNALTLWTVMFLLAFAGLNQVMPGRLWLKEYAIRSWTLPTKGLGLFRRVWSAAGLGMGTRLSPRQRSVIRGVVWSVPVLLMFGLLFASADVIFKDLFDGLSDISAWWRTVVSPRIIFTAVFTMALAGILFYTLTSQDKPSAATTPKKDYMTEVSIMLGMVNALFLTFVIIQAVYLFGGRNVVLDGELTYAEYGRNGFFELVWVALGVFGLGFALKSWKMLEPRLLNTVLFYGLTAQVGVIILSALRRLSLYENAYGFSELRVYAHVFIFFISAAFVLLVLSVRSKWSDHRLLQHIVLLGVGFVLLINVVNVPALAARQNLANPPDNGEVDYSYIMSLSSDAVDAQLEVLDHTKGQPNEAYYRQYLCSNYGRQLLVSHNHWSEFSFGRARALEQYRRSGCQE
jgi:hypothetical protein